MTAQEIISCMEAMRNEAQRQVLMGFFKTAPGQYGHGDEFLGLRVPQTREVARNARDLPLDKITTLLHCRWHEVRLCGLLIMAERFTRLSQPRRVTDLRAVHERDQIVSLYLNEAECARNWDLVDLSAPKILGNWLLLPTALGDESQCEPHLNEPYKLQVLDALADSSCLWRQRIGMVCTWTTSHRGDPRYCLRYAEWHLHHPHDLMHKAVGWMLREMGKHVSMDLLREFLRQHVHEMPRTALRYAIERMSPDERQYWLTR